MEKIKPEDVYYYEDMTATNAVSASSSNTTVYYPKLQARMNVMPIIEKINEIIDRLNKV